MRSLAAVQPRGRKTAAGMVTGTSLPGPGRVRQVSFTVFEERRETLGKKKTAGGNSAGRWLTIGEDIYFVCVGVKVGVVVGVGIVVGAIVGVEGLSIIVMDRMRSFIVS